MATYTGWEARARSAIAGGGRGSSRDAEVDLVGALGGDHPLVRAQRAVSLVTPYALDASALVVVAPGLTLASRRLAVATEASAALVAAILWGVVAVLGAHRRRRVQDVILDGVPPALPVIRSEMLRLTHPDHCTRIAGMLDSALHEGEHWHEYLPASRPPPGVRNLPPNGRVIRDITSCLRDGRASPRAMVLLDRLVQGGYGGSIYQGGPEWVRRELGRIHFDLLEAGEEP